MKFGIQIRCRGDHWTWLSTVKPDSVERMEFDNGEAAHWWIEHNHPAPADVRLKYMRVAEITTTASPAPS